MDSSNSATASSYSYYGPNNHNDIHTPNTRHNNNHPCHSRRSPPQSSSLSTSSSMIRTSAITLHETNHGHERRIERSIPIRDIQAAIKHGVKRDHPIDSNLVIYQYQGKEHIISKHDNQLVTTMVKTIKLEKKKLTKKEKRDHKRVMDVIHTKIDCNEQKQQSNEKIVVNSVERYDRKVKVEDDIIELGNFVSNTYNNATRINSGISHSIKVKFEDDNDDNTDDEHDEYDDYDKSTTEWKSHSVIIVDSSGSMRNSDVNGSRTRFGAVWLSLAQDYIEHRINSGMAGLYDLISIILMGEKAELIIDRWPTSNVLYNKIVDLFHQSETANRLYHRIQDSKKGSKKRKHHQMMKRGDSAKLKKLVRPGGHGCYGPSLSLAEDILTKHDNESSALSLLLLSDGRPSDAVLLKQNKDGVVNTLKEATGRMASKFGRRFTFSTIGMGSSTTFDTLQELVESANDFGSVGSFSVPSMSCAAIGRAISSVATSLTTTQTELLANNGRQQRRVRQCIRENKKLIPLITEVVDSDQFDIYMNNNVEHYEYKVDEDGKKHFSKSPFQHPDAAGVAIKRQAFGEGQERFAFQFFEVAKDGVSVVGEPLVAKESRFIQDSVDGTDNWKARDKFAKRFCKVQMSARNTAHEFNKKLDSLKNLDPDTARVSFLNCSIYYLTHPEKGDFAVIVEQKLDGHFQKWNNNNGWYIGKDTKMKRASFAPQLETLDEDSEKENDQNTGEENDPIEIDDGLFVKKEDVAQAFSHFSYINSGKNMLICDLQGVYDNQKRIFNFTDPVIHYHDAKKERRRNRGAYGRTDMGQKGIQDFFNSHECNCLCDLVTKGFIGVR